VEWESDPFTAPVILAPEPEDPSRAPEAVRDELLETGELADRLAALEAVLERTTTSSDDAVGDGL